jgi:hypothetical protein
MKVAILGCGPAAMAAAEAAGFLGHQVVMISKRWEPSQLHGCQYLHAPIPGFEDVRKTRVTYNLIGTAEEYRRKVYGETWKGKVSPEDFIGEHDAWDIRETYNRMWDDVMNHSSVPRYIGDIRDGDLRYVYSFGPDKIISTIPAVELCHSPHLFHSHDIYATGYKNTEANVEDYINCNGTAATAWYRVSHVFGHYTVEWPQKGFHLPGAVPVTKPLYTNCDCHPEVLRVGRYGEWNKSVLVHQVYAKVTEALS